MSQKNSKIKWTKENVRTLIQHLKNAPVLWKKNHPNKNSNYIFNAESKKIAEKMGLDLVLIKSKIHTLKLQFQAYHKKRTAKKDSASEQDTVWFAYDQMKFLLDGQESNDSTVDDDISIKEEEFSSDGQSNDASVSIDSSYSTPIPTQTARNESGSILPQSFNREKNPKNYSKWPKEKFFKLIELLRKAPSLWDPRNPDAKNPFVRETEIENMANLLQTTSETVRKKIKMFKDQFRKEHRRHLDPKTRNETRWFAYEKLTFLANNETNTNCEDMDENVSDSSTDFLFDNNQIKEEVPSDPEDHLVAGASNSNNDRLDSGTSDSNNIHSYATTSNNHQSSSATKNTESPGPVVQSVKSLQSATKKSQHRSRPATWRYDSFSVYGENVACRMRSSFQTRKAVVTAMHHIDQILYNLEMDMYNNPPQPVPQTQPSPSFLISMPSTSTTMPLNLQPVETTQQLLELTTPLNVQPMQTANQTLPSTTLLKTQPTQQILQSTTSPWNIQSVQTVHDAVVENSTDTAYGD